MDDRELADWLKTIVHSLAKIEVALEIHDVTLKQLLKESKQNSTSEKEIEKEIVGTEKETKATVTIKKDD